MEKKAYTARKLKPANRESWVIEFRHPLLKDNNGKPGRKIRRGLGTTDESIAEIYVKQMNTLLSDESFWQPSSHRKALDQFNEGIVNAFYDEISYIIQSYESQRELIIPLKSHEEDYSRVLLLGSTGAGKTTLLRQIMGTDPITERFPATSTAKTTVFDSEIILSEGDYKGVITFYTESETREMIKESIKNSIKKYFTTKSEKDTLRILLEDEDQRFRLSYIIGKIKDKKKFSKYENVVNTEQNSFSLSKLSETEQALLESRIISFISQIKTITNSIASYCLAELSNGENLSDEDKVALEEQTSEYIDSYEEDDLLALVDEILEEIKERFNTLDTANLVTEKFGWPIYWHKETSNREEFLNSIRFFSSNSSHLFGKLLTPLVSGMRVQGPFKPSFVSNIPKLIILDGEGLGHIPATTSNLPFETISKFKSSDAIVLVDDAQSPMLAPPYAVIKSTAISGHYQKLFICFTHFDSVKGDNLPTLEDKTDHIYGSVDNLLSNLEIELGYEVKKFLVNHLIDNTFYLAHLDEIYNDDKKYSFSKDRLIELLNKLEFMVHPSLVSDVKPTYEVSEILFKIKNAAERFHKIWEGYLFGSSSIPNIKKMHFTQVKALARRLGYSGETGYSSYKPISDFWVSFNEQVSSFLAKPESWYPSNPSDEQKLRKIDDIKRKVSAKIESYALDSIKNQMLSAWQVAYDFSGRGSALQRAQQIDSIYYNVIPIPSDEMDVITKKFVAEMVIIISETIRGAGGELKSIFNHK